MNNLSDLSTRIDSFANNNLPQDLEIENAIDELFDGSVHATRLKSKYEFQKQRKIYKMRTLSTPKPPDNSVNILKSSLKQLHEMEDIGKDTLSQLRQQGEKIKGQKEKLDVINSDIKTSNGIINRLKSWWR